MAHDMHDHFIVCGLGNLGQHCVAALKEFGAVVVGIEVRRPAHWDLPDLAGKLDLFLAGDCRQPEILEQAGVRHCRAVLLVTSDAHVNVVTALAARHLNEQARLVVRSAQSNLNRLLADYLGNFAAFEATQLPAPAFALAAVGTDTIGFFAYEQHWFRIRKHTVTAADRWCLGRPLHKLDKGQRRVLRHIPKHGARPQFTFHAWDPEAVVGEGDVLAFMELTQPGLFNDVGTHAARKRDSRWARFRGKWLRAGFKETVAHLWAGFARKQTRRVALVYALVVAALLGCGTLMFSLFYPQSSLLTDFFATTVLLLGGYAEVFGLFNAEVEFPWWVQLIGLFLALGGVALMGVLYALLTEALLESKFQFVARRPPIPAGGHVVVVGLGRVGQRVAALLHELGQPVVGVALQADFDPGTLSYLPVVAGELRESLAKVNLETARSVVVSTDEELLNMEIGLTARAGNPQCRLIIRIFEHYLSDHLARLLPKSEIISAYSVAADAFTGAAFGENILGVFRLNRRTILVAEYEVAAHDSLNGLLLAEAAYGFAVVPVVLIAAGQAPKLLPADDVRLHSGDKIIFLATIDGMRRIEHGQRSVPPADWELTVHSVPGGDTAFAVAGLLSGIGGRALGDTREQLQNLPATFKLSLYQYQAHRLQLSLQREKVQMTMIRHSAP